MHESTKVNCISSANYFRGMSCKRRLEVDELHQRVGGTNMDDSTPPLEFPSAPFDGGLESRSLRDPAAYVPLLGVFTPMSTPSSSPPSGHRRADATQVPVMAEICRFVEHLRKERAKSPQPLRRRQTNTLVALYTPPCRYFYDFYQIA